MITLNDAIDYANDHGIDFDTVEADHAIAQIEDANGAILDVTLYDDEGELCYRETYHDHTLRHYGCSGTIDNTRNLLATLRVD